MMFIRAIVSEFSTSVASFFRRYHLQNIDNNAIEESSEGVEGAFVESDNQAGLLVLDEGEVVSVEQRNEKCLPSAIFIDICT